MGTLAAIAQGLADNLIERAADVVLKERRTLVLVPRETPFSAIHLENMLRLAQAGAVILPPNPGFYHQPQSVEALVDFIVARILDHLAVPHALMQRWGRLPHEHFQIPEAGSPGPARRTGHPAVSAQVGIFPGGTLALKVFEQRYLDMSADCLKRDEPFGVCLILRARRSASRRPYTSVGTLAHVTQWDMEQLGILKLGVRGGRRFRILESRTEAGGLQHARATAR